ncbi:MAG: sulfurtransferase [Rhodocyclaceae bacterium]|jgi:thiosulfate/3-mercaptopyruvate sulfurtransferase|nr:sulfurtransferase [Rhodocyclaceae bacterium]MCA3073258.1 sulfurtransferase [Rhodocyclaceae bacterium]MCA3090086.1 sulfurtransferase [Rhodocyclaceae bacterium]MCA3093910.1 sulfurtransferase [Rhodocyclaceae bacterium]MCA3098725.1 sulfurtransferase [Rhodocyclaceae bacterium]
MNHHTLISTEALAANLSDPDLVVFDCRHDLMNVEAGRNAYAADHIPGARFAHLDENLSGPKTGRSGRHPLPDVVALSNWLGQQGVAAGRQVVTYDASGGFFAARLWWMLRWLGHDTVAVLDGGLPKWKLEGRPLTQAAPNGQPATFTPRQRDALRVDVSTVLENLRSPDMLIVDARTPERFAGLNETMDPVGGHIPGAVNRFFQSNLESDGTFKPAGTLRREFIDLMTGHTAGQVVHQCGSGVTACHNVLAMEVAGLGGSRLYPGSWSEWCADPARPMEPQPAKASPA